MSDHGYCTFYIADLACFKTEILSFEINQTDSFWERTVFRLYSVKSRKQSHRLVAYIVVNKDLQHLKSLKHLNH